MKKSTIIPEEVIQNKIYFIRGKKVMVDKDLAELYQVGTRDLNKAIGRNADRFPADFMFQLTKNEFQNLMFHFGTSSWGGTRKLPYVFTEQGVAMLSSVLNSKRAIQVNIQIIRTFTKIREMIISNQMLRGKIERLEKNYDKKFRVVFETLRLLLKEDEKPKKLIGFRG